MALQVPLERRENKAFLGPKVLPDLVERRERKVTLESRAPKVKWFL